VNRFKVIEHPLPSFIGVSTKIMLTIKGMEKPIALVNGFSQHVLEIGHRLIPSLNLGDKLTKSVFVYPAKQVGSTVRIGLIDQVLLDNSMFYEHIAKLGFKELSCFCGEPEFPINIIELGHDEDYSDS
jgi:hypothetical protein